MRYINFSLALLLITTTLLQANKGDYTQALRLYSNEKYKEAFPLIKAEALEENKSAQYRLAVMYENGYGTPVDFKQAMYWYKLSSSQYGYIESDPLMDKNASVMDQIADQLGNDSLKRGNEYMLAKIDTTTPETKKLVDSITDNGFFGLQPYQTNYFLPVSYASSKPKRVNSAIPEQDLPPALQDMNYDNNTEVEFQLSLKKQISYDLFGFNEYIYFAYTQRVWWQMYADSAPFRETNYQPEVFLLVPTSTSIDESIGLEAVKVGFLHESNGQEGYRSRSWNRLYLTGVWQWSNLFLQTRAWYKIPESDKSDAYYAGQLGVVGANNTGDDNPDIDSYLGYGDIKASYLYKDHQIGLLWRNNLRFNGDNRGAVELSWSYPFFNSPNTFWYAKVFNGYGESLIDYDRAVTKTSFGFSFSRGLFQ